MYQRVVQAAKLSDIEEITSIGELPPFLADDDPKVRERAEERFAQLKEEQNETDKGPS